MPKCHKFYLNCQWTIPTFRPAWHLTQCFQLMFIGVTRRTSSACVSRLFYSQHFKGISNTNVTFKSTLTLLQRQAFTSFCVIILLNNQIQSWRSFLLPFTLPYRRFILFQQLQPFFSSTTDDYFTLP